MSALKRLEGQQYLFGDLIRRSSCKAKECWNWLTEKGGHTAKSSRRTVVLTESRGKEGRVKAREETNIGSG